MRCVMRVIGFLILVTLLLAVGVALGPMLSSPSGDSGEAPSALFADRPPSEGRSNERGAPAIASETRIPASIPTLGVRFSGGQDRVEPLREANGVVNPRGFHLRTGQPVVVDLPTGVAADVWDCFAATHVAGPAHLGQVCEMTVRAE
jgi:hypothetical protein